MERMLRGIAGAFIIASLLLAHFVDTRWLWLVAFVGLNLFQSAFTNWCPLITILKKAGIKDGYHYQRKTRPGSGWGLRKWRPGEYRRAEQAHPRCGLPRST